MNNLNDLTIKLVNDFKIKSDNENGQNFLVDEEILMQEINEAELEKDDIVLDIGAGFGSIESEVRKICKIIAVEKEVKCYSYLLDKYEIDKNVEIINADALDIVYPKFTKIIANPPYNIIDRIIEKISNYDFNIGVMIIPKTIAEQLYSQENKTSFSAIQKVFIDFKKIADVPKNSFYPEPRVTSTMIKLRKIKNNILQEIFKRREMTVKNAIINATLSIQNKTKRESKKEFYEYSKDIKDIENKQVKSLNLREINLIIDMFK